MVTRVPKVVGPITRLEDMPGMEMAAVDRLRRLGLVRVHHLLFFFPRDYQDLSRDLTVAQLEANRPASLVARIEETGTSRTARGSLVYTMVLRQGEAYLKAVWFNQTYVEGRFRAGQTVRLSGKPRRRGLYWELAHPAVEAVDDSDEMPAPGLVPIYRLTEGISQPAMRRYVQRAVELCADQLPEVLPDEFRLPRGLMAVADAVRAIHGPQSPEHLAAAQRRFRYQELLILQLAFQWCRTQRAAGPAAPPLPATARIDARIRRLLPFRLTTGQERVVNEIAADMGKDVPMHRLLQGDVGSGKTAVAAYAMLLAVAHGYQAALMAPTELLAQQHFQVLQRMLSASRVRMELLVASRGVAGQQETIDRLQQGDLDLVIGTHSLAQERVSFAKLGLVIVDEQHKFGVQHRAQLRNSAAAPHYLVMTATPIPRTTALFHFGDLDVSTIDDLPPGRQPVHVYVPTASQIDAWWDFFARKLADRRQGYIVSPFVDQSSDGDRLGAEQLFEQLASGRLEAFRLGMVHGRVPRAEQHRTLTEFRSGELQALVATSLVEVGMDVPNATLMTVEHAERFGMAQLHQLRGRISRGVCPGYLCLVASDPDDAQVRQRLEQFAATRSGFEVAELDLKTRGAGDLFGWRQHGGSRLVAADLQRDQALLDEAQEDALGLLDKDRKLESAPFHRLRQQVRQRYGQSLHLADLG